MSEEELRAIDTALVMQHINDLMMRFDSVQVFVTRQESPEIGTVAFSDGRGNWYARYGQITEWVENGGSMAREDE